jgi:hypothetical protein
MGEPAAAGREDMERQKERIGPVMARAFRFAKHYCDGQTCASCSGCR